MLYGRAGRRCRCVACTFPVTRSLLAAMFDELIPFLILGLLILFLVLLIARLRT